MKKFYLFILVCFLSLNVIAQFQVTLKVIDNEDGALTNKVDDNNETNVFVYAADLDDNKIYDNGDWWYAMYSGETHSPNGELIKANGTWTWQATFSVAAGDYKWNPHMKTLGWNSINNLYNYATENDIFFSVGADGSISGQTTLELPLTPTNINNDYFKNIKVISQDNTISIQNVNPSARIKVYNISGQLMTDQEATGSSISIQVKSKGIYILNIDGYSLKVLTQ
ncbi:T9SS type A sorting domain-containing protein [Carboxylicivirga sp. N1Y90]|uniref:T9SS type A sorting domain-containing protein n=1 Tax=Carboxylicivirga fragile TaxID=3417571 RepID=UPI003D346B78|nr:T9SS type A sorting domain-containing protein [Marinilabiliaceae bacterium N1Y90]